MKADSKREQKKNFNSRIGFLAAGSGTASFEATGRAGGGGGTGGTGGAPPATVEVEGRPPACLFLRPAVVGVGGAGTGLKKVFIFCIPFFTASEMFEACLGGMFEVSEEGNELSDWWKIYPLSSKFVRWVSLNMAPSSIGTVRRRNFKSAKWHFGLHQKKK